MKKAPKVHYVDNKLFYSEIVKYRDACRLAREQGVEEPRLNNYIGECIYKIAERLSHKPCFISYSFRDEMIDDGIENCIMYFKDFDPEKTQNPFAYFTTIIYYAFLRRIMREEKNRYTTYKFFDETIIKPGLLSAEMSDMVAGRSSDDDGDKNLIPKRLYDNIYDFMEKYESREAKKKLKRKELKNLNRAYAGVKEDGGKTRNSGSSAKPNPRNIGSKGKHIDPSELPKKARKHRKGNG